MSKKLEIVPVPLGHEETLAIHKENMKSPEFRKNLREAVEQAHHRGVGLISMVLMSNPEFNTVKNSLVPLTKIDLDNYPRSSAVQGKTIDEQFHISYYLKLAHDAQTYGAAGIVIGAPSAKNHIKEYEI